MRAPANVIAVFDNAEAAHRAAEALIQSGFPKEQISVVGRDNEAEANLREELGEARELRDMVFAGILGGGLFGFVVGLTLVWLPGVGAVVAGGPLAATLLAGLEGALTGAVGLGLLDALLALGATEEEAREYHRLIQAGHYLVIAHGDPDSVQKAHDLLAAQGAIELDVHGEYLVG